MQPNQQSFNTFVVFHPVAHCTQVSGTMGHFSVMKISLFWKLWKIY